MSTLTIILLFLTACAADLALPTRQPTAVWPEPPSTPLRPPTPAAGGDLPAPAPLRVGATAAVPVEVAQQAEALSLQQPDRFTWVGAGEADVLLTAADGRPLGRWVYAVAAPFATIGDGLTGIDLQAGWQTGNLSGASLVLTAETAAALVTRLGQPGAATLIVPAPDLAATLWAIRPSWTVVPFHQLTPELKVLRVDGLSPLDASFDEAVYPLVVDVNVAGAETAVTGFLAAWNGPPGNRDPARITRVAMTGVTALTRATAYEMELNGATYPGTDVAPVMNAADIAHVSHEVAFAPDCPYPNPIGGTTFCSREQYLPLLQLIGVDVVELTGNHVNDWGTDNLLYTLDLYEAAGMATFGGGRDLAHAAEPALFEHNGNRIAFLGCNPVGPAVAWAGATSAGSRPCDELFYRQIGELRDAGYLVIATLQYYEFYHYEPTAQQQVDFRALAQAGATAVSGSQGHHAQGFNFHNGAFIHYGLGNLFFDQMDMLGTRQAFVDTYVIYDNRLLSVELWTGLIENWSRPRQMTPAEREALLAAVFRASGW
ncbi:MAG TPA: CapA family protein [Anaerolineae bacterium]